MFNKPSGTIGNVSLGPGILYLGASGATPANDVGYVQGDATLVIKRDRVEVRQGSPQTIVGAFASKEDFSLELKGIEWNMSALMYALGDGATSVSGADSILKIGASPAFAAYALQYVHKMADGGTLTLNMWKVIGEGEISADMKADKLHELKMKFMAIDPGTTDWGGASLTDGQKMVKIIRTKP